MASRAVGWWCHAGRVRLPAARAPCHAVERQQALAGAARPPHLDAARSPTPGRAGIAAAAILGASPARGSLLVARCAPGLRASCILPASSAHPYSTPTGPGAHTQMPMSAYDHILQLASRFHSLSVLAAPADCCAERDAARLAAPDPREAQQLARGPSVGACGVCQADGHAPRTLWGAGGRQLGDGGRQSPHKCRSTEFGRPNIRMARARAKRWQAVVAAVAGCGTGIVRTRDRANDMRRHICCKNQRKCDQERGRLALSEHY